jgi:outer membrane protein OmpA-like peptidoglycan-associated protein
MKVILLLILLLSVSLQLNSQNLKINQAELYFKEYRFAEATPIFKELILKDQISVNKFENVYRHAIVSADKSHDHIFLYDVLDKFSQSDKFNFDDAFYFFQTSMHLGKYEKAKEILNSPIILNSDNPKKKILNNYQGGNIIDVFKKDTFSYEINKSVFNSGIGDFNPIYHPKGIAFSSARDIVLLKSKYDNSPYLNLYLFSKDSSVQELNIPGTKKHQGTACYDSINKIWYYSKNFRAKKSDTLISTGIFIYDEKTQIETPFAFNIEECFTAQPSLSKDLQTLWFCSDRVGGFGQSDIWYSFKNGQNWSTPINAGSIINTSEQEMFPYCQKNILYFSSNGHPGLGGLDIFSVELNKESTLKNLGAHLNSNADDFSLILDETEKVGLYSSNRENFIDNIYSFKIKSLIFLMKGKFISPNVTFADIRKVPLYIKESGVIFDTLYPDSLLNVEFYGEKEKKYEFEINDEKYLPITEYYSTVGKTVSDTTYKVFELITKFFDVDFFVYDSVTNLPLVNANLNLRNTATGLTESYNTDQSGHVHSKLLRNNEFEFISKFDGYEYYTSNLSTQTRDNEIKVLIPMTKIPVPVEPPLEVGAFIPMKSLSFEFNKWNLDKESKEELNRIADLLMSSPNMKVEFSSHTDARGSSAYNLNLSKKRTEMAVSYLISRGVKKENIDGRWYGETELINDCKDGVVCTAEEHKENRRTEIKIVSID